MLQRAEVVEAEYASEQTARDRSGAELGYGSESFSARTSSQTERGSAQSERRLQYENKQQQIERLLGDFKRLIQHLSTHLNAEVFVELDDFYFVRKDDQPAVIDYIHRICKDTNAYLKVATIKHRTELFVSHPEQKGVVPGHEIQKIDLDLPLGQFPAVVDFMKAVWAAICRDVEIVDGQSLFRGDGFNQAVLASGGGPERFFWYRKICDRNSTRSPRGRNRETSYQRGSSPLCGGYEIPRNTNRQPQRTPSREALTYRHSAIYA
jgi:hypothetical protein